VTGRPRLGGMSNKAGRSGANPDQLDARHRSPSTVAILPTAKPPCFTHKSHWQLELGNIYWAETSSKDRTWWLESSEYGAGIRRHPRGRTAVEGSGGHRHVLGRD
jgi:hypothetical protein